MSFYVNASQTITPAQRDLATKASEFGDALTLAGPGGPQLIRELRDSGHEPACPHGGSVEAGLPVHFERVDFVRVGVSLDEKRDHRLDVMDRGASVSWS